MDLGSPSAGVAAQDGQGGEARPSGRSEFERLERAIRALLERQVHHETEREAEREALLAELAERGRRIQLLEDQVEDGKRRRQQALVNLGAVIDRVEKLERELAEASKTSDASTGGSVGAPAS